MCVKSVGGVQRWGLGCSGSWVFQVFLVVYGFQGVEGAQIVRVSRSFGAFESCDRLGLQGLRVVGVMVLGLCIQVV